MKKLQALITRSDPKPSVKPATAIKKPTSRRRRPTRTSPPWPTRRPTTISIDPPPLKGSNHHGSETDAAGSARLVPRAGRARAIPGRRPVPLVVDRADPLRERTAAKIRDALKETAKQKWEKKWEIHYEACITDPKACCLVDGKRKDYDGYQGHFALTAHRYQDKGRPLVMDTDKSPIYKPNNEVYEGKGGRLYSGCFINMQVEFWAQDNKTGKGLRATLLGVQRVRDGDAFGGGAARALTTSARSPMAPTPTIWRDRVPAAAGHFGEGVL